MTTPDAAPSGNPPPRRGRERKAVLLRLDPDLHDALARWAAEELRSTNAHLEWLLARAVQQAGRRTGRPPDRAAPDDAR